MSVWETNVLLAGAFFLYDRYRVKQYYSPVIAVEV